MSERKHIQMTQENMFQKIIGKEIRIVGATSLFESQCALEAITQFLIDDRNSIGYTAGNAYMPVNENHPWFYVYLTKKSITAKLTKI